VQKNQTPFAAILLWGIISVGIALLLALFGAFCISKGIVGEDSIGILAATIAAVAVFVSILFALNSQGKSMQLQTALGVTAVYLLFCVAGKALFFRGSNDNILAISIACCVAMIAALTISTVGKGKRKTPIRRRR
jgi:hypothetical protein